MLRQGVDIESHAHAAGRRLRRVRQPSERNLQVFEAVRTEGRSQVEVARQYGLSQPRVAQICQQIDRWWARLRALGAGRDARRAELLLARRRYERILATASRHLAQNEVTLATEKTRHEGGQVLRTRTLRTEPVDPQWGRIVVWVSDRLARLDAELGPDDDEVLNSFTSYSEPPDKLARRTGDDAPQDRATDCRDATCVDSASRAAELSADEFEEKKLPPEVLLQGRRGDGGDGTLAGLVQARRADRE
jgi:hypothetical protein